MPPALPFATSMICPGSDCRAEDAARQFFQYLLPAAYRRLFQPFVAVESEHVVTLRIVPDTRTVPGDVHAYFEFSMAKKLPEGGGPPLDAYGHWILRVRLAKPDLFRQIGALVEDQPLLKRLESGDPALRDIGVVQLLDMMAREAGSPDAIAQTLQFDEYVADSAECPAVLQALAALEDMTFAPPQFERVGRDDNEGDRLPDLHATRYELYVRHVFYWQTYSGSTGDALAAWADAIVPSVSACWEPAPTPAP